MSIILAGLGLLFVFVFGLRLFEIIFEIFWAVTGKIILWGSFILFFFYLYKMGIL